jgi:hypothetical protein
MYAGELSTQIRLPLRQKTSKKHLDILSSKKTLKLENVSSIKLVRTESPG